MLKQSPVFHKFSEAEYEFGEANGYRVPLIKRNAGKEERGNDCLWLCDMSSLNRVGFRGADIDQWLREQHEMDMPGINRAIVVEQGLLIVRLSQTEIMILEDMSDVDSDFSKVTDKTGTDALSDKHSEIYYLPRQDSHSCFMVSGKHCAELFAKLCAIDLRVGKFPNMSVAQTSLARANTIIIRRDLANTPGYFILTDSSLAEYLWDCLFDAMQEFDGKIIGCSNFGFFRT